MRAGTLTTKIIIQRRTEGTDELGQPLPNAWAEHCKAWAHVRHMSGTEAIKAGGTVSMVQASIRIHYRADIDAGMRVLIGAAAYEIRAVLPDMARREHVDLVVERTS